MPDPKARKCRFCDIVWGTVGVTAGFILLYMGVDLLTSGGLSRVISSGFTTTSSEGDE